MQLLIVHGVLMAFVIAAVMVPPLFIYNPDRDGGDPFGPPSAVTRRTTPIPREVQQKLFVLFMVPGMTALVMAAVYWTYYRPVRFTISQMERAHEKVREKHEIGCNQLQSCGLRHLLADSSHCLNFSHSMVRFPQSHTSNEAGAVHYNEFQRRTPHTMKENCCDEYLMCSEVEELREWTAKTLREPLHKKTEFFMQAVHERLSGIEPTREEGK